MVTLPKVSTSPSSIWPSGTNSPSQSSWVSWMKDSSGRSRYILASGAPRYSLVPNIRLKKPAAPMWSRWPWEWTIHFTSEGLKPASQMALTSMAAAPQLPESMSSSPSPVSMRWTHTQLSPTYQPEGVDVPGFLVQPDAGHGVRLQCLPPGQIRLIALFRGHFLSPFRFLSKKSRMTFLVMGWNSSRVPWPPFFTMYRSARSSKPASTIRR